jgi:SMC interacting uncharacterized protein involved in chromosome segregation
MTAKWKEISAYTGRSVEEDAPTNNAGSGAVAMPPDAMMKKKKKQPLIDARTKAYKKHSARLEAARIKREQARKSKFIEKVQESIGEFEREAFLVEDNIDVLKDIVKTKGAKTLKFKDGKMKVDLFTASAITQVMNKVNADNKAKLTKMINGKKGQFTAAANAVMKMVGK